MSLIFSYLGEIIKDLNISKEYIIDTFSVSVCRNIRIPNCKFFQEESYQGFNRAANRKSKKEWFYGFKVQIITDSNGNPVQFNVFCGETGDITAFQCSQINLSQGSSLFGDKSYNDYEQEDFLLECDQIRIDQQENQIP